MEKGKLAFTSDLWLKAFDKCFEGLM